MKTGYIPAEAGYLFECQLCFALVSENSTEQHSKWHYATATDETRPDRAVTQCQEMN